MARFTFSLQKVLDIKRIKKKQEVVKLSALRREEQELLQEIAKIKSRQQILFEHLYELEKKDAFSIVELQNYSNYISFLKYELASKERLLDELRDRIREKAEEVVKLHKDEMILEGLRNKRYIEFLKEENRKEQKRLDEVAILLYSRR